MIDLCNKMIRKSGMRESRPCLNKVGHPGLHTPDLTGLKDHFGFSEVIKRAEDYTHPNGDRSAQWVVKDYRGINRVVLSSSLIRKTSQGVHSPRNSGLGCASENGKLKPEYTTVYRHLKYISDSKRSGKKSYKNMKFYDDWNPNKDGSYIAGADWILQNLGSRPSLEHQLHVIKTKKHPYGFFGPGGIVWRAKMDRHDQDLLDLVCEWPNKKFNDFIEQEEKRRNAKGKR